MSKPTGYPFSKQVVFTLVMCVLGAVAGSQRAVAYTRNCFYVPGTGTLQDCFTVGSCSSFSTCMGYECSGENGCGPNDGQSCIFGGGCSISASCAASCPPL